MLKGVNDSLDDAKLLVKMLKGIPAKINLIPFNPWPGTRYECSDWDQIEKFSEYIFNAGYSSPVRTPRGRDILAACGQLKSETEKLSRARAPGAARHGDDGLMRECSRDSSWPGMVRAIGVLLRLDHEQPAIRRDVAKRLLLGHDG